MLAVALRNSLEYLIRFPIAKDEELEPNRLAFSCDAGILTKSCLCLIDVILKRDLCSLGCGWVCDIAVVVSEESGTKCQRSLDFRGKNGFVATFILFRICKSRVRSCLTASEKASLEDGEMV